VAHRPSWCARDGLLSVGPILGGATAAAPLSRVRRGLAGAPRRRFCHAPAPAKGRRTRNRDRDHRSTRSAPENDPMDTIELSVDTSKRAVVDITVEVERFCAGRGDGLCSIFVPHTTAGLALMETGSGSDEDLIEMLARLLPRDDRYGHRHGSKGHGADHLMPALLTPSIVLPVFGGRPALGTWQSVLFVDTNLDNPSRRARLSFLAG